MYIWLNKCSLGKDKRSYQSQFWTEMYDFRKKKKKCLLIKDGLRDDEKKKEQQKKGMKGKESDSHTHE